MLSANDNASLKLIVLWTRDECTVLPSLPVRRIVFPMSYPNFDLFSLEISPRISADFRG